MDPAAPASPSPTRSCGDCSLCCKVYTIPVLDKREGQWCRHCRPGHGCSIYETRPDYCRSFICEWMREPGFPDHWKPTRSRMVATRHPPTGFLHIQVDPSQPAMWSREPYRSDLARWARQLLTRRVHVLVFIRDEATLIIGEQAIPLGRMGPRDSFRVRLEGARYVAEKVPAGVAER